MWLKEYYEVLGAATKKAQAYTDQEVSKVRTKFAVVASYADLPNPGRTDTIYLVPKAGFVSVYDQYIYENSQYTDIGDTELDLDSYATDLELSQGLATKVDKVEGYGLSKNDFTDEKDAKLAGIETGAQVNVTPDAALDKTSTNAIQNKAVTEKFEEVEAEILNEDKVAEGNPITIETGSIETAKSTELTMSPIQDLHGYNKPWVGGAGKNLVDNSQNIVGGYWYWNTQLQNAVWTVRDDMASSGFIPVKANTTYMPSVFQKNGTRLGNAVVTLWSDENTCTGQYSLTNEPFITEADTTLVALRNFANHSEYITNDDFLFQLEQSSTATSYAPYSNICPISGRTQAEIVRCGKNLLEIADGVDKGASGATIRVTTANNGEITLNGEFTQSNGIIIWNLAWLQSLSNLQSDNKKHLYNGTYKATGLVSDMRIQIVGSNDLDANTSNTYAIDNFYIGHETVTLNTDYKYVWLRLFIVGGSSFNNVTFRPMIYNTKYDDSTYEQFTKNSVTIPFGSTIYGGTMNVETGVLTVTHKSVDMGSLTWTYNSQYDLWVSSTGLNDGKTNTALYLQDAPYDLIPSTAATNKGSKVNGTSNVWVRNGSDTISPSGTGVYELATPTTTTLTAAQVNLLKGLNNVSTDADSIKMTYTINDFVTETEMNTALESKANVIDLNGKADLTSFGPLEEIIASANYAEGDYMIFEGKFCKASSAITAGDTLEIGTNLTETTIAAELLAIISQLPTT